MICLQCIAVERRQLPFVRDFINAGQVLRSKDIVIISVKDQLGKIYQGEVGPFPGVHDEDLDKMDLDVLLGKEYNLSSPSTWNMSQDFFGQELPGGHSSLVSAWEQILYQIKYLGTSAIKGRVEVAGLLNLAGESSFERFKDLIAKGYRSIKVKVGREDFDLELGKIKNLLSSIDASTNVQFRIDGNQSMGEAEMQILSDLMGERIHFFEEPKIPFSSLESLSEKFPIALDESLWDRSFDNSLEPFYLVLKPMRVGLSSIFNYLQQGIETDRLVLSSCFESGLASQIYLDLALRFGLSAAHGLGPYDFLKPGRREIEIPFHNGDMILGGEL